MPTKDNMKPIQILFKPNEAAGQIKQRLIDEGADSNLFSKAVYVIRLKTPFSIAYPNAHTPVLYIGAGRIIDRLNSHRRWASRMQSLGYPFPMEVVCYFPQFRNNKNAHWGLEAHLLSVFFDRYGSLPLKNSNHANNDDGHDFSRIATTEILGPGRGNKHMWAIRPLPANPFRRVFEKTHGD
jgi:hypothetical protein